MNPARHYRNTGSRLCADLDPAASWDDEQDRQENAQRPEPFTEWLGPIPSLAAKRKREAPRPLPCSVAKPADDPEKEAMAARIAALEKELKLSKKAAEVLVRRCDCCLNVFDDPTRRCMWARVCWRRGLSDLGHKKKNPVECGRQVICGIIKASSQPKTGIRGGVPHVQWTTAKLEKFLSEMRHAGMALIWKMREESHAESSRQPQSGHQYLGGKDLQDPDYLPGRNDIENGWGS
eukprot:jgi/Mesvir1/6381/Mv12116-RA.1